ncbi:MAG: class II aldolase/adducin family protein [Silvibacterium sp.]
MQWTQLESQLLEGCRRLARKGFLSTPTDSFSLRIPGHMEMILVAGSGDWERITSSDLHALPFSAHDDSGKLHTWIYQDRADVGAVALSSSEGTRLLASHGGVLPPIFDEQVRHIGRPSKPLREEPDRDEIRRAFSWGTNVALLGDRLLCLGMTCDRVLFNTELFEKCAQAYVIARASGSSITFIPSWVQMIANHRLLKDERRAALSYSKGRVPEDLHSY